MLRILSLQLIALSGNTIANTNQILLSKKEVECLSKNIYYESRGEPIEGQIAVGWVTLNRVKSEEFPDTICEVVYQKGQFSWTSLKMKIDDIKTYLKIKQLSTKMILMYNKNIVPKEIKHAKDSLYFRKYSKTCKLPREYAKIGNHAFSKEYWMGIKRNRRVNERIRSSI